MLELLSPAGSHDAVIAAVQNGADSIYLGFESFNARRDIQNFTEEEFEYAARYCRVRGCRLYLTMNTLVTDNELRDAERLALSASRMGADAIIVRDLGLAHMLRSILPDMPLHADTRMAIHNLAGAEAAFEMGFSRVTLARELSMEQMRYIGARTPIELQVIVHGSLCFSYAGQCYMSAALSREPANRGLCAQPCRLHYAMGGRLDDFPLCLKDSCLISHLDNISAAGIACVKIEGRSRRPEYTALVTSMYSRAIKDGKMPASAEMLRLQEAFSTQGFTDGYLVGGVQDEMFGVSEEGGRDASRIFAEIRREYTNKETRRVPITFYASVREGDPAKFAAVDSGGRKAVEMLPPPMRTNAQPLTQTELEEQLYRTGGTPYLCSGAEVRVDPGLELPPDSVSNVRRKLLSHLADMRAEPKERREGFPPQFPTSRPHPAVPLINVQVLSADQMSPELASLGISVLYVPLELLAENLERAKPFVEAGTVISAVLPRIISGVDSTDVRGLLKRVRAAGVSEALVGNMGHIRHGRLEGFAVRADYGLNACNTYSLSVLEGAGFLSSTISFELSLPQVADMVKAMDTELIVYGRLPLMVSKQCVIKKNSGRCTCQHANNLSDRKGSLFPVMREFGCRNVIYAPRKLFLADRKNEYETIGLWAVRLMFTTENPKECVQVTRSYMGLSDYRPNGLTRGLYYSDVE